MGILKNNNPSGDSNWVKEDIIKETNVNIEEISELTEKLFAEKKHGVLLVLQGMDASGKDGLTKDVFSKVSPTWVNVVSFKKPSDIEMLHDYWWRIHKSMPEKGTITVFNRSHYEEILIPSVYETLDKKVINKRYKQIDDFEIMLEENNIHIVKIYLNLSYEKQEEKLLERINNIDKHWKHSDLDWETRKKWNEFMNVYEEIFDKCNSIKWNIVPADKNWTKNYATSKVLLNKLKEIDPKFPDLISEKFKADYTKSK
ncbi:MAG: PPK2 family polyphosphate kinase [Bacteroidota bacterium]